MMVPLSDAVANRVPCRLVAIHDNGARCASITLIACNETGSKTSTWPLFEV